MNKDVFASDHQLNPHRVQSDQFLNFSPLICCLATVRQTLTMALDLTNSQTSDTRLNQSVVLYHLKLGRHCTDLACFSGMLEMFVFEQFHGLISQNDCCQKISTVLA